MGSRFVPDLCLCVCGCVSRAEQIHAWCARTVPEDDEDTSQARDKFANSKAISSDMYFGRNDYDPVRAAEAQARSSQFKGATGISSNAVGSVSLLSALP